MSATITWKILQMSCYPQYEGETDVVFMAAWICEGVEVVNNNTFRTNVNNTCQITLTEGTPFTPYNQLTQNQVLGWIWENGVDKTATELAVQNQLNDLVNPPVVTPALPWAN